MAKLLLLLPLSLCLLVLFNGCFASRQWYPQGSKGMRFRHHQFDQCQIDKLDAVEPTSRVEAEAGVIETWDHNNDQFRCAGVAVSRITVEQQGLFLPSYSNAPELVYIERGRGFQGVLIPGCPETFQDSQQSQQGQGSRQQDQHQKIRHFREGDIIAIPAGAAHWCYNDGDTPVVAIVLHHMNNYANQLDQNPRKFYLAGSPEEEFEVRGRQSPREKQYRPLRGEREHKNVFGGFDEKFLADAFNVDTETARRLMGQDDTRRNIIRVKGGLGVIRPPMSREERGWQEGGEREREREREWERPSHRGGRWEVTNGFEETICSMRLRENIGDPSRADIYTPEAGRISHANGHNLPVLRYLQLSAERGFLYDNAIHVPHWNLNAHSVIYVIRGSARVQVVDNYGQSVFNGELRKGQILTVPQNFAVVKRSGDEGFEWVSFKTNDNAMISPLAGRTSAIRALPVQVLANAYQISEEEARRLKFNRQETTLFTTRKSSGRRVEA